MMCRFWYCLRSYYSVSDSSALFFVCLYLFSIFSDILPFDFFGLFRTFFFFFLNNTPPPEISPLPLPDALPIYGLLLALGVFSPRRMVILIFPPIPMQARFFVILFGGLELLFGVTGTAAGVAHFAHLGGMLGGWLAIQYRRRGFPFTRRR